MAGPTQATILVELAEEAGLELFHGDDGTEYGSAMVSGHLETWILRSKQFRAWIVGCYFARHGSVPSSQPLQDAIGALRGKAVFEGERREVGVRVAGDETGAVYLDLADEAWRKVRVTADGWQIVASTIGPRFRRPKGMLPLPKPVRQEGALEELPGVLNLSDDVDLRLVVGSLVGALRPTGPYPPLLLTGEQGSAKSTTARLIVSLIDPRTPDLRSTPRDDRDLMVAARNAWMIGFDNLSSIPDWLSDAFCRLSTGGGFATRALFTDDEEILFSAQRPIVLNSIEDLAARSDLLDRALILTLPTITDTARRSEQDLWRAFELVRPGVLGALLDGVAAAIGGLSGVHLKRLPRMADFAMWVVAAESAFPWPAGAFLEGYEGNRAHAHELALEGNHVAEAVQDLVRADGVFEDRPSALLDRLGLLVGEDAVKRNGWPKNARALSWQLNRLAPNLRAVGVDVTRPQRSGNKRPIRVAPVGADDANDANDAKSLLSSRPSEDELF